MRKIFFLVMIFIGAGCNNDNKSVQSNKELPETDTSPRQPHFRTVEEIEQFRQRLLDSNYSFLGKMLDTVLRAANQRKQEDSFSGKIDTTLFRYKEMYATYEFVSRTYLPDQNWIQTDGDFGVMIAVSTNSK